MVFFLQKTKGSILFQIMVPNPGILENMEFLQTSLSGSLPTPGVAGTSHQSSCSVVRWCFLVVGGFFLLMPCFFGGVGGEMKT